MTKYKRLNSAMKKLLQINNMDYDKYFYLHNNKDYVVFVEKKTGKRITLDWSDL